MRFFYEGYPELMIVITEKNPNTAIVPRAKIMPNIFLFFIALKKPKIANNVTSAKIIAVTMFFSFLL